MKLRTLLALIVCLVSLNLLAEEIPSKFKTTIYFKHNDNVEEIADFLIPNTLAIDFTKKDLTYIFELGPSYYFENDLGFSFSLVKDNSKFGGYGIYSNFVNTYSNHGNMIFEDDSNSLMDSDQKLYNMTDLILFNYDYNYLKYFYFEFSFNGGILSDLKDLDKLEFHTRVPLTSYIKYRSFSLCFSIDYSFINSYENSFDIVNPSFFIKYDL